MDTKSKLSDKLDNMIGNFAEGNMPDHAFLKALRECVAEAERIEVSQPTLNIGMGEIKESEVLNVCEIYADNYPIEGRITVNKVAMRKALEVFLIAHTKAVTVDAIVKLVEEWDAYCVVTSADPDGIEDLRARLLNLTQQP